MNIKQLKIGDIVLPSNVLMAPLAGFTNFPFRKICYELGAGLCFTEMAGVESLKYKDKSTELLLLSDKDEPIKAVQLLGSEPKIMEEISQSETLKDFDIIDINMGCPVPNVFKNGKGSALLADLKKSSEIIKSCKKSGKTVTVKIRVGITNSDMNAGEFAKMCEDSGVDMISIHGRSRNMMYEGVPYFEQIEQAKSVVSIPVIANGGIFSIDDAENMINKTGADGVMIARYALENPFIFSHLTKKDTQDNKLMLLKKLIDITKKHYDETYTLLYIKKITAYFMKKVKGGKIYKIPLFQAGSIDEILDIIDKIFQD